MRPEQTFGKAAGLKQGEAEQDGVTGYSPYGGVDTGRRTDTLYQDAVNRYADHNQEALKAQRE